MNWNPNDKKINECKVLRIAFPNGDTAHIKKETLMAVLFACGSSQEQINLIPQRQVSVRQYKGLVRIKAAKNIEKGEEIVAHLNISLPEREQEIIKR